MIKLGNVSTETKAVKTPPSGDNGSALSIPV